MRSLGAVNPGCAHQVVNTKGVSISFQPRAPCACSYYYVKSYAEGTGVIHLPAGIV